MTKKQSDIILQYLRLKESLFKEDRNYWASQLQSLKYAVVMTDFVSKKIAEAEDNIGYITNVLTEVNAMIVEVTDNHKTIIIFP